MTTPMRQDATRPLIAAPGGWLKSESISDYEPVFTGLWFSRDPQPRFGDAVWNLTGRDPVQTRSTWRIDFTDLTPEWGLIAREVIYWRANIDKARHRFTIRSPRSQQRMFKAVTILTWRMMLGRVAEMSATLGIGLPSRWGSNETEMLRDYIRGNVPNAHYGNIVSVLHQMRDVLTLGGLSHDPTLEMGTARWSGDTAINRDRTSKALEPQVFQQVVGNALTYIDKCSDDILRAAGWKDAYTPTTMALGALALDHPVRMQHPEVNSQRALILHDTLERIGGIPTATVASSTGRGGGIGGYCRRTLHAAAGLNPKSRGASQDFTRPLIDARLRAGTPLVPGGLPLPVAVIDRPDGTSGPWRDPFCWDSIDIEAQTLSFACKIVIMAFTAMRVSEMELIPRSGWRTTWMGADAITAPLVKNAWGEPMKWWATPPVIRACEILEQLARGDYLFDHRGVRKGIEPGKRKEIDGAVWDGVQLFVRRLNTDPSLHGFNPVRAGWGKTGHKDQQKNDQLPTISPHRFRFTLASISNFVALGDVAFQQQAKHAKVAMSHSYQANSGTRNWNDILNTVLDSEADKRSAKAFDLHLGVWTGEAELAGHAGRELTRTVRDLLDDLPLDEYDPHSEESQVDQFTTQVVQIPELAAAIRSTAVLLHPGTICHCLRYTQQMECTNNAEPNLGMCHPQTCANVLLEPEHSAVYRARREQTRQWLATPGISSTQSAILERAIGQIDAQLRTEDNADGA